MPLKLNYSITLLFQLNLHLVIISFCKLFAHRDEDMGALIVDGSSASTVTRFHPVFEGSQYAQMDAAFRDVCCNQAKSCNFFFERRPQVTCDSYRPPGFG